MEIFLNIAWAVLAIALVVLWLRIGCRMDQSRRSQIIAIAVLIAILFPVISVSDDLMAVQNSAETDNGQRRDHLASGDAHLLHTATAIEPPPIITGAAFGFLQHVSPGQDAPKVSDHLKLTPYANRPPPMA
ncbi:hypothetical protein [Terracidiphilus sp.]|uniref:hypothetical protein n=1 Tax=Terracidiphilus sp. TaxID=1964191 RepID=UPI003C143255